MAKWIVLFWLLSLQAATLKVAPPKPWSLGIAAPPRIALAGDVDGDGFGDLLAVYPVGSVIVDVSLNVQGMKPGIPFQAAVNWGQDCQAAVAANVDNVKGDDVVGLFGGKELRLAGAFADGKFADTPAWVTLPLNLSQPRMSSVQGGSSLIVWSQSSGEGFSIDIKSKETRPLRIPKSMVWLGHSGALAAGQDSKGKVFELDPANWKKLRTLGVCDPASRPVFFNKKLQFEDHYWDGESIQTLDSATLPQAPVILQSTDMDNDGDHDLLEFRYGKEHHTANQAMVRRTIRSEEIDSDHDGLSNSQEQSLETDPFDSDTDTDGLLDGWEVNGFRDLKLNEMGCSPRHSDVICLVSRFDSVNESTFKSEMAKVDKFYADLPTQNPNGKSGFAFHPIYLDVVTGEDKNQAWWVNRDKFLPKKWKGMVHWMQVTPGGGGQADQLGDGGSVAENALWAVFVHEFGHQMGMDHEGFWPNNLCPIYSSLMNYAYSYGYEDDYNKIHYSDGRLSGYVLNETDLDETIPLSYEKVKFLEKGPYRFRLRPHGEKTLIDWNWNGIFGEKHVRADINYSYSTNAGPRMEVDRTMGAPCLFTHKGSAYVVFGQTDSNQPKADDPTISLIRPGKLMLRKLGPKRVWGEAKVLLDGGLLGDPFAISHQGKIRVFFSSHDGVIEMILEKDGTTSKKVVCRDRTLIPTAGLHGGYLFVFLTDPVTGKVVYRVTNPLTRDSDWIELDVTSKSPVGLCTNKVTGNAILAVAQDQDDKRKDRWQIRQYALRDSRLKFVSKEWIQGEDGGAAGTGRMTVLFETGPNAGPEGRTYVFAKGLTDSQTKWACTYVAHQIQDKSVSGGWMVKRFYDEWTQSRSAPSATWFQGDVLWGYRWVDGGQGASDNILHVGFNALGVQPEPMGDHDDLTFLRTWGMRSSITYLSAPN